MNRSIQIIFILLTGLFFSDCSKDKEPEFVTFLLRISHKVGSQPLVKDQLIFNNSLNQKFSITRFNYYLSNVKLRNMETGSYYHEVDSYHLVKVLDNTDNTEIILKNIPKKRFSTLELSIGVDNSANHSVDKVGDLDPSNFMAWDWTTGYKFFEMTGKFQTDTAAGDYVFHVGDDSNYKTLTFNFKDLLGTNFDVVKDGQLILAADVSEVFSNPNPIDFNVFRSTMVVPQGSVKVAANYAEDFLKLVGAQ